MLTLAAGWSGQLAGDAPGRAAVSAVGGCAVTDPGGGLDEDLANGGGTHAEPVALDGRPPVRRLEHQVHQHGVALHRDRPADTDPVDAVPEVVVVLEPLGVLSGAEVLPRHGGVLG